jgi:hypothetical protein
MYKRIICILLLTAALFPLAAEPDWVLSYGSSAACPFPEYLSGYGFSDHPRPAERLAAARDAAVSQLSRQVRMRVTSVERFSSEDDGTESSSRYLTSVQTASELVIGGARFEIYADRGITHALAYIETEHLYRQFLEQVHDAEHRFRSAVAEAEHAVELGELQRARSFLGDAAAELTALREADSVCRAIAAVTGTDTASVDISGLEELLRECTAAAETFRPQNLDQAAAVLAEDLGSRLSLPAKVMPLLYEDGDFSSTFGSRTAVWLEERLNRRIGPIESGDTAVVRGTYWVDEEQVEIYLTARSAAGGKVLAAARSAVPLASLDADSLRPANADTAFADGQLLLDERIVDGGIEVEVWTSRGRGEHSLVFSEGEEVQFYFRVSEPAFLQISYVLVTGETVLLEESFYIGIDRVNRVVALPYTFQAVPPFGVERLIVTAHANFPPKPDVLPGIIEGQRYDIFRSTEAAVAATRGLARVRAEGEDTRVNVGEASLVITTMAGERE